MTWRHCSKSRWAICWKSNWNSTSVAYNDLQCNIFGAGNTKHHPALKITVGASVSVMYWIQSPPGFSAVVSMGGKMDNMQ